MDPFDDLFSEPIAVNARAGAKFQPKAKLRNKKEVPVLASCNLRDSAKEKPVTTEARHGDTSKSMSPSVDPAEIGSTYPSLSSVDKSSEMQCTSSTVAHLETQDPLNNTRDLHPEFSVSGGDRSSASLDVSPQFVTTKGDAVTTEPLFTGDTQTSDIRGDKQTGFGGSGETADIISELESLDNFLSRSAISSVSTVRKFQPRARVNGQPRNKLPVSRPFTSEADCSTGCPEAPILRTSMDLEEDPSPLIHPSEPTECNLDFLVSQDLLNNRESAAFANHGDLWMDDGRMERGEEVFQGFQSLDIISQATTTTGDARLDPSENEYLEEDITPAYPPDGFVDFSTMGFSDSVPGDAPPEFQVTKELENLANASGEKVANPDKFVDSDAVNVISAMEDERLAVIYSDGNGTRKSLRQLKKRLNARADEMAEGTRGNQDLLSEPSNNSLVDRDENNDDDDNEYIGEETTNHKRTSKIPKKPVVGTEKMVRKRQKTSEGSDSIDKEPPKKKFSHSTRRNKRRVDKVLLETPDDEINPQKLPIKDLIMLAEAKERLGMKDANVSKNLFPNQSHSFAQDSTFSGDDPYGSMQGQDPYGSMQGQHVDDDDEAPHIVQHSSIKLNYHSYMDRTPRDRWSKQDTELFYQGLHMFGPNFAMIQQLLLGRTRNQVKLKFKREERQHPQLIKEALENRSHNQTLIDLVIERIKKAAAEAEQNSDREESIGLNGEEEVTPETNEGVAKVEEEKGTMSQRKEEEVVQDMEAEEVVNQETETEEDTYNRWSQYKSDYDYEVF